MQSSKETLSDKFSTKAARELKEEEQRLSVEADKEELLERLRNAELGDKEDDGDEENASMPDDYRDQSTSLEVLRKELELAIREKELAVKERRLVEKEKALLEQLLETSQPWSNRKESVTPHFVAGIIPPFDGTKDSFENWKSQILMVKDTYNISESVLKMAVVSNLRDRALSWYQSNTDYIRMSLRNLLKEFEEVFGTVTRRIEIRKQFENRRWRPTETFLDYFQEKMQIGNKLQLDQDEMIEYIIDGITDSNIRNLAKIQKFRTTKDLILALNDIKPREGIIDGSKRKKEGRTQNRNIDSKCFNCGLRGHWASNCRKPKRQWGTCFKCGKEGHRAEACPQNKMGVPQQDPKSIKRIEPDYLAELKFKTPYGDFSLDGVIDSGSPISLICRKYADDFIIEPYQDDILYTGLNSSRVKILGIINTTTIIGKSSANIKLHVVPDDTMSSTLIIGRDFLSQKGIRLHISEGQVHLQNSDNSVLSIIGNELFETEELDIKLDKLDIGKVAKQDEDRIINIFENYLNLLNSDKHNIPTFCMQIKLKKEEYFSFKPRRLSYKEREDLYGIINDLLEQEVIRTSTSPYCSPIVLVKKKTGDLRMCVDYRQLNKITVKEHFPIPVIEDHLQLLAGKKYFSSLDLKNAYYNVRVSDESINYTSFITPFGQYEFLRMPFGLVNAPSIFQRYITELFRDLLAEGTIMIYFDDIFFGTKTLEEHFAILKKVLEILGRNGLELRLDKCHVAKTEISYLGYEISSEGIKPCRKNVEAIVSYPTPKNLREVQSFLGMCSYFRKFVNNFSLLAKPLYDLLKKDAPFLFDEKCVGSFNTLKQKLVEQPVLALYSPKDETELHCDASSLGFGAILLQKKSDNKMHPVFFFSKRATPTESKYHSFELETLAIIYALQSFRVYLHGLPFKIVTDCNSLTLCLNKKDINPRIARWALELQDYDYEVYHRESNRMKHVDALSRAHNILVLEGNTIEQTLALHQYQDDAINKIRKTLEETELKEFELREGLVYRKSKDKQLLFYVPEVLVDNIIRTCHDDRGHFGVDKTTELFLTNYWFPKLRLKVQEYIRRCLKCMTYQPNSGKPSGVLHSIPKGDKPFHTVHVDHFGPLTKSKNRYKHIFVIVDAFTRFVRLYPVRSTNTAETINCLRDYFRALSRPDRIISDRGSAFTSKEFDSFCMEFNIKHVLVATACPQANGAVERVNRVIRPMLAKSVDKAKGIEWPQVLSKVEFAINNSKTRSTGESPSKLLFGLEQKGENVDHLREYLIEKDMEEYRTENLESIRKRAAEKSTQVQEYNEQRYNLRHRKPLIYSAGDLVNIVNVDTTIGVNKKLIPAFRGPFVVIKVLGNDRYLIEDPEGYQNTSKPFKGVFNSSHMRLYKRGRNGSNIGCGMKH